MTECHAQLTSLLTGYIVAPMVMWAWESWSYHSSVEELASVAWTWESWFGGMTNSATTEAQIQGFELANSKIFFTYELLEYVKGPNLLNHSYRISREKAVYARGVSVRVQ